MPNHSPSGKLQVASLYTRAGSVPCCHADHSSSGLCRAWYNLSEVLPWWSVSTGSAVHQLPNTRRCQISGGSGPDSQNPVQCQEVWAFDDDRAEMQLVGLQAVCPEIYLAKRLLRQLDDNTRQTAMWTLQAMNE